MIDRCMIAALLIALAVWPVPAESQSRNTEHTLELDEPGKSPPAEIADFAWLTGSWRGEAFGGICEETWSAPSAGTMVGTFKLIHDKKPSMYEIFWIGEQPSGLAVMVKHFNDDYSAWEEKSGYVTFPLVSVSEDAAHFAGLTYKRDGADRLLVYLAVGGKDGVHEEKIVLDRVIAEESVRERSEGSP